jgi:hypothetical protein
MATNKKRLNVTVDSELETIIEILAKRDQMSQSAKAVQLMKTAIELDEDEILNQLAESRDNKKAKFISHDQAWK